MKKYTIILVLALAGLSSCHEHMVPMATKNTTISKTGIAKGRTVFGLGSVDASIESAAKNGGITKIATVDHIAKSGFLFLTTKYTTTVTGE